MIPCGEPDANPDDWFIRPDGKQYPDDDLLTFEERARIAKSVLYREGETADEHSQRVARATHAAENDRRRAALQRRRKAREACYECPARTRCLDLGVTPDVQPHGTYGGYFEEQIREIRDRIRSRKKARQSQE